MAGEFPRQRLICEGVLTEQFAGEFRSCPMGIMTERNSQISRALDEAIAWQTRINVPDLDEDAWIEFTAWLEADPSHRLAFDRVETIDAELDNPRLKEIASEDQYETNLRRFPRAQDFRRAAPWMAGAGIAASLVLVFLYLTRPPAPVEYATRIGETRMIALSGGTTINLNTATKLVAVDPRHVVLEKGEAIFHVTRDPDHPFTVTAGDRNIRDIGTVFDVLHHAGMLSVVVAEGAVGVSPKDVQGAREITLQAGDKFTYAEATGVTNLEKVDPGQALAWRKGYLVYRDAPLSAVIDDLNRYFPVPVSLDEQAASQRFTGVLRIDTQDRMLNRLARFLPLTVERETGKIILRGSRITP